MTGSPTTGTWQSTGWDDGAVRRWLGAAGRREDLEFAWGVAAAVAAEARPGTVRVLDAASGPGGFLATVLHAFPGARGIWLDASPTMEATARQNLAGFGDRVEYRIGDLLGLDQASEPGSIDLILTSRATHHLVITDLTRFYQQAARLLAPNGWIANLDIMTDPGPWGARLRAVRARQREAAGVPDLPGHPQTNVGPGLADHLAALRAAGFAEAEMIWRVFMTELVMARRRDPSEFLRRPGRADPPAG